MTDLELRLIIFLFDSIVVLGGIVILGCIAGIILMGWFDKGKI